MSLLCSHDWFIHDGTRSTRRWIEVTRLTTPSILAFGLPGKLHHNRRFACRCSFSVFACSAAVKIMAIVAHHIAKRPSTGDRSCHTASTSRRWRADVVITEAAVASLLTHRLHRGPRAPRGSAQLAGNLVRPLTFTPIVRQRIPDGDFVERFAAEVRHNCVIGRVADGEQHVRFFVAGAGEDFG